MTTYHILNGDCLAEQMKQANISGSFIICRECLIEGDLNGEDISSFWDTRANYITKRFGGTKETYYNHTAAEFEKIINLPPGSEVCLWFEHDLFCQINMWFTLSLLANKTSEIKIYRVSPVTNDVDLWKGFGISNAEMLEYAYTTKIEFTPEDILLGDSLWKACQQHDLKKLKELSTTKSDCIQYLEDVCEAYLTSFPDENNTTRPQRMVKEIIKDGFKTFEAAFAEFSVREGIYGLGDLQFLPIYEKVTKSFIK